MAALDSVALIGRTDDGDGWGLVAAVGRGRVGWGGVSSGSRVGRGGVGGASGSHGDESSDQELDFLNTLLIDLQIIN